MQRPSPGVGQGRSATSADTSAVTSSGAAVVCGAGALALAAIAIIGLTGRGSRGCSFLEVIDMQAERRSG